MGNEDESKILILSVVNTQDRSIVKVTFKEKPKGLRAKVLPDVTQNSLSKKTRIAEGLSSLIPSPN
jgi:hypothetical protein